MRLRAPLVNIPKVKKASKPIRKVSPKQAAKKQAMAKCLDVFFEKHGWMGYEEMEADCQLCLFIVRRSQADFHHRQRASQAGTNTSENGLSLHRLCHRWLHDNRDIEDAALECGANLENGRLVSLSDQRRLDLFRYLGLSYTIAS